MNHGLSKETVDKIQSVFALFPAIEKAVLYGSRAKGNFKPGSDIDLTLLGDELTPKLLGDIDDLLDDLLLPYTFDLSIFDRLDHVKLREHIERVGVILYNRKKTWITKKLGEITTKIGSGATPLGGEKAYKPVGISLIRSLNIHDSGFRDAKLARIDGNQASLLSNVVVEPDDVLLNITGASVARCCVVPENYLPARVNQHVSIIRPIREIVQAKFLYYLLISRTYKDRLLFTGEEGGATRQAITKAQLQEFSIDFPESIAEQQRIVTILDKAFAEIAVAKANAEKNLRNARGIFEGYLEAVFDTSHQGPLEKLNDVCEITSNLVDPRNDCCSNLIHIGAANIESQKGTLFDLKTAREEGLVSGKFIFDKSMVLYSKIRPYLMKVARPTFDGLCSADIYPLKPRSSKMTRDYLFYLLLSKPFTAYAIEGSARAGMPKVNRQHLFEFEFFLPSLDKQNELSEKLDAIAAETQHLVLLYERKLVTLEALKKSLLHQAFTGNL